MLWQGWLRMIIETARQIGEEYQKLDDNKTGIDDLIGTVVVSCSNIVEAVLDYVQDGAENKKTS